MTTLTQLEKKVFEKYINYEFLSDILLYSIIEENHDSIIFNTLNDFIENLITKYELIRAAQITTYIENIDNIIKNEPFYHALKFTNLIIQLIKNKEIQINIEVFDINEFKNYYTKIDKLQPLFTVIEKKYASILKTIINNPEQKGKIKNKLLQKIVNILQIFEDISNINDVISNYEKMIESINEDENDESVYLQLNKFKKLIQTSYVKILESNISADVNKSDVLEKNSIITFGSENITKSIIEYITKKYEVYKTGLKFIDDIIDGIESETVNLICAPSNHGKSLMLFLIAKSLIETNIDKFENNDVILHISLEDNNIKLTRRIFSIFGNCPPKSIKQLYFTINKIYNKLVKKYGNEHSILQDFQDYVYRIFAKLEEDTIKSVTKNKVLYMIQDQSDTSYSVVNLVNTLTVLETKGYKVRAIILDYIDLMTSSKRFEKDYDEHGQIIKDLRNIAKTYHIPIITATQLKRESENYKTELSNNLMGDSHKKVRFSDYIFMFRQRLDLLRGEQENTKQNQTSTFNNLTDLTSSSILYSLFNFSTIPSQDLPTLIDNLIPVEYSFTKVKDSEKTTTNTQPFLIFSKFNLSFYDSVDKLYNDFQLSKQKEQEINNIINQLYETFLNEQYQQILHSNNSQNIVPSNLPVQVEQNNSLF